MSSTSRFGTVVRNSAPVGIAVGAAAFVVNYLVISLFLILDGVEGGGETAAWKFSGNALYNAQFAPTEIDLTMPGFLGGGTQTETLNLVRQTGSNGIVQRSVESLGVTSTVPALVYHAVPIVVLVLAGLAVARYTGPHESTTAAIVAGLTIVPATLVLSIVGVFLFDGAFSGQPAAPAMLTGVLLVGIGIPAVAGALGGAAAAHAQPARE